MNTLHKYSQLEYERIVHRIIQRHENTSLAFPSHAFPMEFRFSTTCGLASVHLLQFFLPLLHFVLQTNATTLAVCIVFSIGIKKRKTIWKCCCCRCCFVRNDLYENNSGSPLSRSICPSTLTIAREFKKSLPHTSISRKITESQTKITMLRRLNRVHVFFFLSFDCLVCFGRGPCVYLFLLTGSANYTYLFNKVLRNL